MLWLLEPTQFLVNICLEIIWGYSLPKKEDHEWLNSCYSSYPYQFCYGMTKGHLKTLKLKSLWYQSLEPREKYSLNTIILKQNANNTFHILHPNFSSIIPILDISFFKQPINIMNGYALELDATLSL